MTLVPCVTASAHAKTLNRPAVFFPLNPQGKVLDSPMRRSRFHYPVMDRQVDIRHIPRRWFHCRMAQIVGSAVPVAAIQRSSLADADGGGVSRTLSCARSASRMTDRASTVDGTHDVLGIQPLIAVHVPQCRELWPRSAQNA